MAGEGDGWVDTEVGINGWEIKKEFQLFQLSFNACLEQMVKV